jgi:uncharacterized membrane protein YcaP (DUF421 family)
MEAILRTFATAAFVWLMFRIAGKRSLAQITTFDFVVLLILSESTQQAMTAGSNSLMHAYLSVAAFVGLEIITSYFRSRSKGAERILDSAPLIILQDGVILRERMQAEHIDDDDILCAARERHGLERMDQLKYAVLETDGHISIVPKEGARRGPAGNEHSS